MKNKKVLTVLALSLGLPTTILGVSYLVYYLIQEKIISSNVGLFILVAVVGNMLYLIIRNAIQKNKL